MRVFLCTILLAVLVAVSASTENNFIESQEQKLVDIMCELHLGDIPSCPASSCKEVADTKLRSAQSGYHWLVRNVSKFQAYCTFRDPAAHVHV